ncbi:CooT family nickel-binding protein [Alkalibacter rhizosphaerae]|uniref:CooT family nickel-binding protein n=1 Tax=Alkalibacter rhizosphaerae TaxID=2815577 RepID=A0A975AHX9_9FIRM|nr:CooT family nickel-binding protein [Alkalibacter rhizosphaerae]QSX09079.1 CooT family nickel-binding protein [Alkalibacter rhizosphaerae]
MCLGKVYEGDDNKALLEDVKSLEKVGNKWVFTSIFGDTIELEGELDAIDFGNSKVVVRKPTA